MGKKKKHQFIDKKSAHKFTLVHRSQRDPLQADEDAGNHVLMPMDNSTTGENDGIDSRNMTKEEKARYGITYDDDYDYMQHLRPRGEGFLVLADNPDPSSRNAFTLKDENDESTEDVSFGNVKLPSNVFASAHEEDIGMLNKGALPRGPQPDWDPDIVQALDDDVDFEDPDMLLDDDFISKANAGDGYDGGNDLSDGLFSERRDPSEGLFTERRQHEEKDNDDGDWETASEDGSYISSDNLMSDDELDEFADEETKTRFTNYSMTSSIIRRTEGLKVLDDRFERIMEEYDEDEIGCIEQEEVQGVLNVNNKLITNVIDDFYQSNKKHALSETKAESGDEVPIGDDLMNGEEERGDEDEKLFEQFMKEEPKEKWDCESIISTYSNIYNHPKLIEEESRRPLPKKYELHKRTGIPIGVFDKKSEEDGDEEEDLEDEDIVIEAVVLNNVRNKGETPEERKQRKKDVKEQRKNRRVEKKTNKMAFKYEQKKQEKVNNNTIVQKSIQKL